MTRTQTVQQTVDVQALQDRVEAHIARVHHLEESLEVMIEEVAALVRMVASQTDLWKLSETVDQMKGRVSQLEKQKRR